MEGLLLTRAEVGRKAASAYVHSMVLDDLLSEDSDGVSLIDDVDDFLDTTGALAKGLYDFGVVLGTPCTTRDSSTRRLCRVKEACTCSWLAMRAVTMRRREVFRGPPTWSSTPSPRASAT